MGGDWRRRAGADPVMGSGCGDGDLRALPNPSCCVRTQGEDSRLWTREQGLTRHGVYQHLCLGLAASRTVEIDVCGSYASLSVGCSITAAESYQTLRFSATLKSQQCAPTRRPWGTPCKLCFTFLSLAEMTGHNANSNPVNGLRASPSKFRVIRKPEIHFSAFWLLLSYTSTVMSVLPSQGLLSGMCLCRLGEHLLQVPKVHSQ